MYNLLFNWDSSTGPMIHTIKKKNNSLAGFGFSVIHQHPCGQYKIDFYVPDIDLMIEYDENNHSHYDKQKEKERQNFILSKHNNLCRVSDDKTDCANLGVVAKHIFSLLN